MNKTLLSILLLFCFCAIYAQSDQVDYPPRLHEIYNLDIQMPIKVIADTLGLAVSKIKESLLPTIRIDENIDNRNLISLNLSLDDIYQLYLTEKYEYNDFSKIGDVAKIIDVPYSKLATYLNLDPQNQANRLLTIRDIRRETLDLNDIKQDFDNDKLIHSSYLMVLCMIVIFIALLLTSIIISQLVLISRKTSEADPASIISKVGRIITDKSEHLHGNAIVAVIATIEKLKADTVTESRIMMTFRRTQVNMWHASGKVEMTTIKFNAMRMRRKP
jgi:hypothetical protein